MSGLLDHGSGEVALRNLVWMAGNLGLAWSGLLVVWLVLLPRRRAVWSARILIALGVIGTVFALLSDRADIAGVERDWLPVALVVLVAAVLLTLRYGRPNRAVQMAAVAVAVSLAPNAPYVLTDTLHLVQDLRVSALDSAESALFSLQYGIFTIAGAAPWILLLGLGRRLLRRRWPRVPLLAALFVSCAAAAAAIYIGRIERVHTADLIGHPTDVAQALWHVVSDGEAARFVAIWTVALFLASAVTLRIVDRIRSVGGSGRELVAPAMFALSGMLLAGVPSLAVWDARLDLPTATPSGADAAACLLGGILLGSIGIARIVTILGLLVERTAEPTLEELLQPQPSMVPVFALGCILAVPVVGSLLMGGATAQWWAQYRGMCEHAPRIELHGDRCP